MNLFPTQTRPVLRSRTERRSCGGPAEVLAGLATLWSWRPVSCGVESFIRQPGVLLSCVLRTRPGSQDGSVLGTEDGVWRALVASPINFSNYHDKQ